MSLILIYQIKKTIAIIRIDGQLKCIAATINLHEQVFKISLNEFRLGLVGELEETLSISATTDQTIFFSEYVRLVEELRKTLLSENIDLTQTGVSDFGDQSQSSTVSMFKTLTYTLTGAFVGDLVGAGIWTGPFFWFFTFVDSTLGVTGGNSTKTWGGLCFLFLSLLDP